MSFLFRKRIKLFPGVGFNLSKHGVRTSFGGKGLTVDIKEDKITANDSVPDSGLSYGAPAATPDNPKSYTVSLMGWSLLFLAVLEVVVLFLQQ